MGVFGVSLGSVTPLQGSGGLMGFGGGPGGLNPISNPIDGVGVQPHIQPH